MFQCVSVCFSVFQCVLVCFSVFQCVSVCFTVFQCVSVCFSVFHSVSLCVTVSHCVSLLAVHHVTNTSTTDSLSSSITFWFTVRRVCDCECLSSMSSSVTMVTTAPCSRARERGPVRICQFVHSIFRFFDDISLSFGLYRLSSKLVSFQSRWVHENPLFLKEMPGTSKSSI